MSELISIGVDVGGTKTAIAAADPQGNILAQSIIDTIAYQNPDGMIAQIAQEIERLVQVVGRPAVGVGIALPGPVDAKAGLLVNAANLGWRNVPVRDLLKAHLRLDGLDVPIWMDLPIWVQNDVKAGVLGELVFGAARGASDFVLLFVGTGLGGGAVINGQLVNGVNGWAMEVGHMSLHPKGRLCTCGKLGCAQMVVSGVGLLAGAAEHKLSKSEAAGITTHHILEMARGGDQLARVVMDEAAEALGIVMAWCAMILNPDLFVIGGGLGAAAYDLLIDGAMKALRDRVPPDVYTVLRVAQASAQSPALGASALVWHEFNQAHRADV